MAKVFDLDFENVRVTNRDFAGKTFGPDQRQFRVVVEDPELIERLKRDGAKIKVYEREDSDDPVVGYLTVKVSFNFGGPKIALITPEGNSRIFDESTVAELDNAWIENVDIHVHGSSWERPTGRGVTTYLDTFVGHLMSKEAIEERRKESQYRSDPIRDKYRGIFGD